MSAMDTVLSGLAVALPIAGVVYLGSIAAAPFIARPFLKIEEKSCPTNWSMLIYVAITICICASWYARDKELQEDGKEATWLNGSFYGLVPIFLVVHPLVLVVPRACFQRTISKWPGLLVCETVKLFYISMFIIVLTGNYNYGTAFKAGVGACLVCALAPSALRLMALINVCRSEEGFSIHNFNAYYYGTSRKCPFSPFMCQCEKDRSPELVNETNADDTELVQES